MLHMSPLRNISILRSWLNAPLHEAVGSERKSLLAFAIYALSPHLTSHISTSLAVSLVSVYVSVLDILTNGNHSIDTKTDEIMQRVIREKFCNHTIIAVAHKL